MNRREGVAAAGGMIVQAFPHASEESRLKIEKLIKDAPPFSTLLEKMPIEDVVAQVLTGVDYKQIDSSFNVPLSYKCRARRSAPSRRSHSSRARNCRRWSTRVERKSSASSAVGNMSSPRTISRR
jgi:hypothetical protein